MKRKKRTPEERRAERERYEARQRELHGHIERIKAELAEHRRKQATG